MENRSQRQTTTKIIELTPDKEIPAHRAGRIYDLVKEIKRPERPRHEPPPQSAVPVEPPAPPPALEKTTQPPPAAKFVDIDDEIDRAFEDIRPVESWLDKDAAQVDTDIVITNKQKPENKAGDEPALSLDQILPTDLAAHAEVKIALEPKRVESTTDRRGEELALSDDIPKEPAVLKAATVPPPVIEVKEEVIDLEEIVTSAPPPKAAVVSPVAQTAEPAVEPAEEVIDLVDIITETPASVAPSAMVTAAPQAETEDEIIDLVDIVSQDELKVAAEATSSSQPAAEEEEIIDLVDIVTEGGILETTDASDDDIIELVEIVTAEESETTEVERAVEESALPDQIEAADLLELDRLLPSDEPPISHSGSEQVIKLADVLNQPRNLEVPTEEITFALDDMLAKERLTADIAKDTAESIGIELSQENSLVDGVSAEELESTIEKIVREKYAVQIESLIARAVEKAVTREIQHIKREYLNEDENDLD
jgi:hypothetical protein